MWVLTVRSPSRRPHTYVLKDGKNTLGRNLDNDIVIADESASRAHAEIHCHGNVVVLCDLGSTNGTFVNRERLTQPRLLRPEDQIRVGEQIATIALRDEPSPADVIAALLGTQPLTRDLMLESVDQNAVLLYEVANRLNAIADLDTALQEASQVLRVALGADKCEVILAERFDRLAQLGIPTSIARQVIEQRSVVVLADVPAQTGLPRSKSALLMGIRSMLCVPVTIGADVAALIYAYKSDPASQPFDQDDLKLAVAISHQAALAIQRTRLQEKARQLEHLAPTDGVDHRR